MADETDNTSIEGPGKGKPFFDRAKTVATTGNYDYAIDMYIEGLNREPTNIDEHKALCEVAMHRKVKGGKPAGGLMGPKTPFKGKGPKEAMLNAEWILAKDVGNIPSMLTIIRNAAMLNYPEIVRWLGPTVQEANRTNKTPKFEIYVELSELYRKIEEYGKARDALLFAVEMKPNDGELQSKLMQLAALETLKGGKYEKADSFTDSIKDKEGTKQLLEQENLNKSKDYLEKAVGGSREEYEKNPLDPQLINKYANALRDTEDEDFENKAIEVLTKAYAETKIYRWKMMIGEIRIRQFNRNIRMLKEMVKANPNDKELQQHLEEAAKEQLAFEVEEYRERADNLPTDMAYRYELGKRLFALKRYDEAIVALQEAQNNAKIKVEALNLLGRAFLLQHMIPEAVDTLKRSIDEYDLASTGNAKARELYYYYARALEENKNSQEAIDVYSKIVRWDISYKDTRKRMTDLRNQLGGPGSAPPTT